MILVNLGCGEVYHPDWQNFDVSPVGPEVRRWDIRRPLPFAAASVDAVYSSHVLEHLTAVEARLFLAECRRILRAPGVIRLAVPDLEGIARAYLKELATCANGGDPTLYHWCRLELYDQLAREYSGGEMATYARGLADNQALQVQARAGMELTGLRKATKARRQITVGKLFRRLRFETARLLAHMVGGRQAALAMTQGSFRLRGEVHRVMYDRISLAQLLSEVGFQLPHVTSARSSEIPHFVRYELDTLGEQIRKPDSLYMEAKAP